MRKRTLRRGASAADPKWVNASQRKAPRINLDTATSVVNSKSPERRSVFVADGGFPPTVIDRRYSRHISTESDSPGRLSAESDRCSVGLRPSEGCSVGL